MIVFLGDIAFYLATLTFAAGIFMLHQAKSLGGEKSNQLLRSGGLIVTTIAILGFLCTGYYWMKYFVAGAYENPGYQVMSQQMMNRGMNHMAGASGHQRMMEKIGQCLAEIPEGTPMDSSMHEQMQSCLKSR